MEYTATYIGDKTLKSQRVHNHETANKIFTESEDTQTLDSQLRHRKYIQASDTSYYAVNHEVTSSTPALVTSKLVKGLL